ncbi:LytTR family DNA-binding domain-containing protein [Ruminococcaceae bacterium OttesenSCG-928-D13]|nr:LytTR family DNA-binding domain-containing protein [Ruminococcaceae bacterium OttesenSCG-928-D13]
MYIAICEDNPADRAILAGFCSRYAQSHSTAVDAILFENTAALLADDRTMRMGAVILDIQMNGFAYGVEAARTLRQSGYQGGLVFVTVSTDYYAEGFEVGALHYLVKPVRYDDFEDAMDRVMEKQDQLEQYITVTSNRKQVDIPLRGILYAMAEGHKTILHTTAGAVPVNLPFTEVEALLSDSRFLKCYRSCIVNMEQVERVEEVDFQLKNGEKAPITQRRAPQIKAQYMHYMFGTKKNGV